jgi:hypothetical protein
MENEREKVKKKQSGQRRGKRPWQTKVQSSLLNTKVQLRSHCLPCKQQTQPSLQLPFPNLSNYVQEVPKHEKPSAPTYPEQNQKYIEISEMLQ